MIIETGAEPIFKPLSYARYLQTSNSKEVQMEVVRSQYSSESLINLSTFVINEFRTQLRVYNMSQRTTILGNITRHMCFMHTNA